MNERKKWYEEHGICVRCGQNDAVKGIKICLECRFKEAEKKRKYYENNREKVLATNNARYRDRYKSLKERGVCVHCGKRPAAAGKVRCGVCLAKDRIQQEKIRRQKGVLPRDMLGYGDYCSTCGKPSNGEKLCRECYEKAIVTIAAARKCIKSGWQFEKFILESSERK